MKKILSTLILPFALLAVGASGQTPESGAILYEVSGKKLQKPSYVLGTFHALCPSDMIASEKLNPYLDKTEQMILELDMDDPAVMQSMVGAMAMPGGKTLKDLYTDEEYIRLDTALKNTVGVSVDAVKGIRPTMLSVMLLTNPKSLGCTPSAVDTMVMQAAVARKIPVSGVETVESQRAVLNSQSIEKEAKDLLTMASDPAKSAAELKLLMAAYKAQDADKLYDLTANAKSAADKEFHKTLLERRNVAWIPKLETAMAEKPAFVAVGAGHLGGPKGVINLLKKNGYKVRPIRL